MKGAKIRNLYIGFLQLISFLHFRTRHFKGKSKLFRALFDTIPEFEVSLNHVLGFRWQVHSRESLWTFLVSCEKETTRIIQAELRTAKSFVCVGANFGWYPLVARAANSTLNIYAFECDSKVRQKLESNLRLNNYEIHLSSDAIGEKCEVRDLYRAKNSNDGMSTLFPGNVGEKDLLFVDSVQVNTLDSYFSEKYGEMGRTIVLMDIEGSEMRALVGAKKFIEAVRPILILEVCSELIRASGYSWKDIFTLLQDFGYIAFWIDERGSLLEVKDFTMLPHSEVLPIGTGANYLFKLL